MDWPGNRPSIGPIGLVSLSDRLVQLSHVDRRLIRLQNVIRLTVQWNDPVNAKSYAMRQWNMAALDEPKSTTFDSGEPYLGLILSNRRVREMGSGVIYYEYEKREKFEDYDMKADAELGAFRIRRYHFDNESLVHPLHSVWFDPDRPYEIPIEALMADKILSASKDENSVITFV
ncbi:hypothetical protein PIB30_077323 [Stylosanthes scabra]|uniref:Uncharacterized protein n=1 Tax=Stylosanthes scabra TaxID=79078 RepID=A0ABU6SRR8_9FABA|nr:hypothetical protein [Stylosanthes scabra]